MARTRIISANKALYTSMTGCLYGDGDVASGIEATQLHRIDTVSFDVDIAGARQDVREFGQLARLTTLMTSDLTANLNFGYYLTDGENENHMGFETKGSIVGAGLDATVQAISGFLSEHGDYRERNYYVLTVGEGKDAFSEAAFNSRTEHDTTSFGNGFINNFSLSLAVGEIPRADVSVEASNIRFDADLSSGIPNPAINPTGATTIDTGLVALPIPDTGNSDVEVLRAGQIVVDLQKGTQLGIGGTDLSGIHVQSVSFEVPLSREALERLGDDLPYSRPLTFPLTCTASVNAVLGDMTSGQIANLLTGCAGQETRNVTAKMYDRCDPSVLRMAVTLKNAVLDNESFSTDLDGNETVDLQFSAQIGGADSTGEGFYMTGSYWAATKGSVLTPTLVSGLVG